MSPKGILKKTSSSPRLTGRGKGTRVRVDDSPRVFEEMKDRSFSPLPVPSQLKKLLAMTQGQSTSLKTLYPLGKKPVKKVFQSKARDSAKELKASPHLHCQGVRFESSVEEKGTMDPESDFLLLQAVTRQLGLPTAQYQLVPTSVSTSVPTSIVIASADGYQVYALRQ